MSYINWGNETPEQIARRHQLEEENLYEQAAQTVRARQGQSTVGAAAGGSSAGGTIYIDWYYSFFNEFGDEILSEFYIPGFWTYFFTDGGSINPGLEATSVGITENLPGGVFRTAITLNSNLVLKELAFSLSKKPTTLIKSFLDPSGLVTEVGYAAFSNSDGLVSVSLPGCTTFSDFAQFSYCDSLVNVNLPALTTTGGITFYLCTALEEISLPSLTTLGGYDFNGCSSLTTVNLPSATNIPGYTFEDCTALTTVNLPEATAIGNSCFENCSSLVSISLPEATSIGNYCFYDCTDLANVSIPKCTNLGETVAHDHVFDSISAKPFTLTIDASRETCDGGDPDGDIDTLTTNMAPNTVTINYV